jgi:uncharacterized protein (TIGR02246 family)
MLGLVVAVPVAIVAPAAVQANDEAAVMAALEASAAGWNAGSLDRFMSVYADDATFVTESGAIARGRDAIAANYAPSFTGDGNARGRLSFEPLSYRQLSRDHAVLTARWTLTPPEGAKPETGLTTVVFARQRGGWKIVADHSAG